MTIQESTPVSEPAVEAPAAEVVEAPASGETAVETPSEQVVEPAEAGETGETAVEAPAVEEPADPFNEFGGRETIEAAHRLYEASQTDEGLISLFLEAGRNLGLGFKEMQSLFAEAEGGEEVEPPDPDEPLTRREYEEMIAKEKQTEAQKQAEALKTTVTSTVQATVKDLGLDPADPTTKVILNLADEHVKGDWSTENVARAVRQGHADFQANVQKQAEAYLAKKVAAAETVPTAPAGSTAPAGEKPPEPMNVAEAIKRARATRYGQAG